MKISFICRLGNDASLLAQALSDIKWLQDENFYLSFIVVISLKFTHFLNAAGVMISTHLNATTLKPFLNRLSYLLPSNWPFVLYSAEIISKRPTVA